MYVASMYYIKTYAYLLTSIVYHYLIIESDVIFICNGNGIN